MDRDGPGAGPARARASRAADVRLSWRRSRLGLRYASKFHGFSGRPPARVRKPRLGLAFPAAAGGGEGGATVGAAQSDRQIYYSEDNPRARFRAGFWVIRAAAPERAGRSS